MPKAPSGHTTAFVEAAGPALGARVLATARRARAPVAQDEGAR